MTTLFQPLGEHSRREIVLGVLQQHQPEDVITYEALAEALDLDATRDRQAIQGAVHDAAKDYLKQDHRAVEAVRTVGYRIVTAEEHIKLSDRQQRRASRALQRGHRLTTNVNFTELSPEAAAVMHVMAQGFAAQMDFNRRFDRRLARQERATENAVARQDRTAEEVQELRERLARLEAR